jgi:hypothetical protein
MICFDRAGSKACLGDSLCYSPLFRILKIELGSIYAIEILMSDLFDDIDFRFTQRRRNNCDQSRKGGTLAFFSTYNSALYLFLANAPICPR